MAPFSCSLLLFLSLFLWDSTQVLAKWQTLNGQAPLVIANGGTSGLYPDQTLPAYIDALNYSLPGVILTCNLQMAQSLLSPAGTGFCRTGLDLKNSTSINILGPQWNSTHVVDGENVTGWFAVDIPWENLTTVAYATQSNLARSPAFDAFYSLIKPENFGLILSNRSGSWWLNSEYTDFIEENSNFNVTGYMVDAIGRYSPGYVSSTEIGLLKKIQATALSSGAKVIYKFLDANLIDPSVNQTYGSILKNLTDVKTFASGILVPKSYILSFDPSSQYLLPPTSLVEDAHNAKLEVYAYNFANDQSPNSYNYTFDPITEVLSFIESYNFSVDGIVTDFPTTASEAISCYASSSQNSSIQNDEGIRRKQKVISHNGDSGRYPGSTIRAYTSAIEAGVDYIDCIVQITNDSVPFCQNNADLLLSTDVASSIFLETKYKTYPGFNGGDPGVFSFDLTWDEVNTLNSNMFSPFDGLPRDKGYDGQFKIVKLADFLALAKANKIGVLIDIQNAVYLRNMQNLAVVDAVVDVLSASGYNSSDTVILQSEDSSALARLIDLNVTYPRMYRVAGPPPVSLTATDFVDIKKFASSVNLYSRLIEPLDINYFLLGPPSQVVRLAHDQNLTAYFQVQRDEATQFAFDLKSDPTLELHLLIETYEIDGVITDFPTTVINYQRNQCIRDGLASNALNFSIPLVVPGLVGSPFLRSPPAALPPDLEVLEPPLSGLPSDLTPAPTPSVPAAASHVSACFLSAVLSAFLYLLVML